MQGIPATPLRNPKLKRRTATQQKEEPEKNLYDISIDDPVEEEDEPPLKRFKKMFEESDPDRLVNSQTQGPEVRTLSSIVEQAYEERTEAVQNALQAMSLKKRKRTADDMGATNEDEEMRPRTRASSRAPSVGPPPSKRLALAQMQNAGGLSTVPEVSESQVAPSSPRGTQPQKTQPSMSTPQAKPAEKKKQKTTTASQVQPDRDENFLKALASTKKGKKKEDQYDRDFNELRVARPTQAHLKAAVGVEEDLEAWKSIEKDMDIRGNFMVVMQEIEPRVPREPEEVGMRREGQPKWVGRPEFKKFERVSVEVGGESVVTDENCRRINRRGRRFTGPNPLRSLLTRSWLMGWTFWRTNIVRPSFDVLFPMLNLLQDHTRSTMALRTTFL